MPRRAAPGRMILTRECRWAGSAPGPEGTQQRGRNWQLAAPPPPPGLLMGKARRRGGRSVGKQQRRAWAARRGAGRPPASGGSADGIGKGGGERWAEVGRTIALRVLMAASRELGLPAAGIPLRVPLLRRQSRGTVQGRSWQCGARASRQLGREPPRKEFALYSVWCWPMFMKSRV